MGSRLSRHARTVFWLFFPLSLVNLLFSANFVASLFWIGRLFLYAAFVASFPRRLYPGLAPLFIFTATFQVILAAVQVQLGHTVQGPLYWLGERALSVGLPNVAKGEFFGEVILRGYGTFSHPNVLAGWLVVVFLILAYLRKLTLSAWLLLTVSLGIFLAQSRTAAVSYFGLALPYSFLSLSPALRRRLIFIVPLALLVLSVLLARSFDLPLQERFVLQRTSFAILAHQPVFGSGANSSISLYPAVAPSLRLLQPDHNSFSLGLSWIGLVGLAIFVLALRPIWLSSARLRIGWLLPLLPLLFFDHYFLTSPQGIFVLLLYLRVIFA